MSETDIAIKPLGAGDLVDRAVRFYRAFFWTFVAISSPPVIIGTVVSVAWTLLARELFSIGGDRYGAERMLYYFFIGIGGVAICGIESIATLAVMGGASRNFVRHLLFGEAITFRETYRNVTRRLLGLIAAATMIVTVLGTLGTVMLYVTLLIEALMVFAVSATLGFLPILAVIAGLALGMAIAAGSVWLFFLIGSRLMYVPQVMLVEGQGVFSAIGRSASLGGRHVRRLIALFLFSTVATYSALALFYVPLVWFGSSNGVQISFDGDMLPAWFQILSSLIWQLSFILLTPIWMIGLCLLYVDDRVRYEGYDVELMAAARLGDIPEVPETYINPLQPALAPQAVARRGDMTTLGLG